MSTRIISVPKAIGLAFGVAWCLVMTACSSSGSSSSSKISVSLTQITSERAGNRAQRQLESASFLHNFRTATVPYFAAIPSTSGAVDLESLIYFVSSINICKAGGLSISGSGASTGTGCVELYSNVGTSADYFAMYNVPTADGHTLKSDYDSLASVDLVNPASLTSFAPSHALTAADAGDYVLGVMYWYRPVRITARAQLSGASSGGPGTEGAKWVQTKTGGTLTQISGSSDIKDYYNDGGVELSSSTTEPTTAPGEAIAILNNGGSWFAFAEPYTITAADISAGTEFKLDLTFNPDAAIHAYTNSNVGGQASNITDTTLDSNNEKPWIEAPLTQLAPILHKDSETVVKQVYYIDDLNLGGTPSQHYGMRLEFYSLAGAPSVVYGMTTALHFPAATTTFNANSIPKVKAVTKNTDGTLNLMGYDNLADSDVAFIRNFSVLSAVGDTGTATVVCDGVVMNGCDTATGTFSRTYRRAE